MNPGFAHDGNLQRCYTCNLQFIGRHACPGLSYGEEIGNVPTIPHVVRQGENMEIIARNYGIADINFLLAFNKHFQHANQLFPGNIVNIPRA